MFGKFLINLDSTVFEFRNVVGDLPKCNFFIKGNVKKLTDFGSVFLIDPEVIDLLTPDDIELIASLHRPMNQQLVDGLLVEEVPTGPHFKAPHSWRMPQVLKALGAFKSSTGAAKNGWDFDIPEGVSEFQIRINNIKGVITLHKVTSENGIFNPQHWTVNSESSQA